MTYFSLVRLPFLACILSTAIAAQAVDSDSDGVDDSVDNCSQAANADQRDSNDDGFGNVCDADLNNDLTINITDLGILRSVFFSSDADADADGDGVVNISDLGFMRAQFFGAPGPGAQTPTGFTQRPSRLEYDYDNNGVSDGSSEFEYDAEGRVITSAIIETPDGVPDLIRIMREDSVSVITYDEAGNMETAAQDFADPASVDTNQAFQYDENGILLRQDRSDGVYTLFVYEDSVAVQSDSFLIADDSFLGSVFYSYDANGFFDNSQQVSDFGTFVFFDYDWNPAGQVIKRRLTPTFPDSEVIDFVRVDGRLENRVFTNSAFTSPPQNYVETFVYDETSGRLNEIHIDANDDGVFEAKFFVFWEDGPCQIIRTPIPSIVPVDVGGLDGDPDSPIGEINLCAF